MDGANHYWHVLATDRIWSSASRGYVDANDDNLAAWKDLTGYLPTRIASEAELVEVLTALGHRDRAPLSDAERLADLRAAVNAERDRRILLPKSVTLDGIGTISVDMAGGGRENIGDLGTAALAKASIGDNSTISFRDADNQDHDLTNAHLIAMGLQVAAAVSAIHVAARALKALDPIPADYATNEEHWP